MRRSDLLTLLIAHTGDLRPGDGSTHAELTDLRRAVLAAAPHAVPDGHRSSQSAPDEALRRELEYLVESHITGNASAQPGLRLWRRGTPGDGGTPPDWAVAMRPERTFGPFLDSEGGRVWYDLFHAAERWFTVRYESGGPVLLALPWEPRPDERHPLTAGIPAGTVWIAAGRLDPAAPANAWAGLRITSIQADGQDWRNVLLQTQYATPADEAPHDAADRPFFQSIVVFPHTTVRQRLTALGLPDDASLSVVAVELLPARTGEPLGTDLGGTRVLRTSALTPVPEVCTPVKPRVALGHPPGATRAAPPRP